MQYMQQADSRYKNVHNVHKMRPSMLHVDDISILGFVVVVVAVA